MSTINSPGNSTGSFSLRGLSQRINRPSITLTAVIIAVALGAARLPFLEYFRAVGDFYVALLKICVLPFLLATIPLAVRSAMASGSGAGAVRSIVFWLILTLVVVGTASVFITSVIFHYATIDDRTMSHIGALLGQSSGGVDVEFAIDPRRASASATNADSGIFSLVPTNIFAALSANDSLRVLSFALVFGVGMVVTERQFGHSIFGALRHVQAVCMTIFDWFNVLMPFGIIALIAPQIALLGPDVLTVLTLFASAFVATGCVLVVAAIVLSAISLRASFGAVFSALLKPMMLGASTRNTLICIPIALEALKEDLSVKQETCDLFIPIGFAALRFGTVLYFIVATFFIGTLEGRSFSPADLAMIATLSTVASFATLGLNGIAALSPLALVLRPFGLSYEIAVPLMIVIDPIAELLRVTINVAVNCMVAAVAGGYPTTKTVPA
jgi:proton glutamate symport protein